jgi:CspA family cold shock protein
MLTGTVKFFNTQKGYGFITGEEDAADYFIHVTCVERSGLHQLVKDQKVSFTVKEDLKTNRVKVDHVRLII